MPQLIFLTIAILLFAAPLGFFFDLPQKVRGDESFTERLAQWISTIFHTIGPLLLALKTQTPWLLFMASLWGLFGSIVLARRIGAMSGVVGRVYRDEWWRALSAVRVAWMGSFVFAVLATVINSIESLPGGDYETHTEIDGGGASYVVTDRGPRYDLLHDITSWIVVVVTAAMFVIGFRLGKSKLNQARQSAALVSKFSAILSVLFGVSKTTIENEARMRVNGRSEIEMHVVPPAIAAKLTRANMPALDAGLAQYAPEWEIDEASDYTLLTVRAVTPETERRRAALAATGGMFVADAPQYLAPAGEAALATDEQDDKSWVIDLT